MRSKKNRLRRARSQPFLRCLINNQINQSPPVNITNMKSSNNPKNPLCFMLYLLIPLLHNSTCKICEKERVLVRTPSSIQLFCL